MIQRLRPIGVFDSGVGGLSVLRRIQADLPGESLVYVADSGYAPYGERSAEFVTQRAFAIAGFLLEQGIKALVVACNTATAAAIRALRDRYEAQLPIIGIEPALKPAISNSRSGIVGVLATEHTVRSDKFTALLGQHGHRARVVVQPCPGLADCVERGDLNGACPRTLLARYLEPLLAQGVDTLVLGCTHYPFLLPLIQHLAGPEVTIIDPSPAVARQLYRRLEAGNLLVDAAGSGTVRYYASGALEPAAQVMADLLGYPVVLEALPAVFCQLAGADRSPAIPVASVRP